MLSPNSQVKLARVMAILPPEGRLPQFEQRKRAAPRPPGGARPPFGPRGPAGPRGPQGPKPAQAAAGGRP